MKRIISVLIVLLILLALYTFANANHIVQTHYTFTSSKIDKNAKILYISDIHYGCVQDKDVVDATIKLLTEEKFDVVLLGGDIVQCPVTSKSDMCSIIERLGTLQSKYGIYFVYGNHDSHDDGTAFDKPKHNDIFNSQDLDKALLASGIEILSDKSVSLDNGIMIIGRSNSLTGESRVSVVDLVNGEDSYIICLDHAPIDMSECSGAGVDLQISGHTHGGQIFPVNVLQTIAWKMPSYGVHTYGNMKLVVSSGMGVGAYPLRNAHQCEYVIIDILCNKEE